MGYSPWGCMSEVRLSNKPPTTNKRKRSSKCAGPSIASGVRENENFMLVVSLALLVSCLPSAWFFYSKSNKNVSTRRWHEMIQLLGIKRNRQKLERLRKLCCNLKKIFLLPAITFFFNYLHFFCPPFWLLSPSLLPFPSASIVSISIILFSALFMIFKSNFP